MQLLWEHIRPYRKILWGTLALAVVNQTATLFDPQIFRMVIDRYASRFEELTRAEYVEGVLILLLGTVALAFISRVAKNFQDYYMNVVIQRAGTDMYAHSVRHSFSLPFSAFEEQQSGALLSKLQKARADSQTFITSFITIVFLSLVSIVFVVVYAFTVHWVIGVSYILLMPVLATVTYFLGRKIKLTQMAIVKQTAALAGSTTETIRNVELVKSLGLEEQEIEHLNSVNSEILQLELRKIRMIRALSFIQGTLVNALRTALVFLMLYLIFERVITLGEYFSLLFYSFFVFEPLQMLSTISAQYQETNASLEQLEEVLEAPPEEKPANAKDPKSIKTIEFENVDFLYKDKQNPAVEGIDLKVKRGETIAFVGPSGSGKSTMVKLLVGLYKPINGQIKWNDISHSEVDFEAVRKRIGLVLQETQLFAGSVRENLLFVRPNASDEKCWEVLKFARLNELFEKGKGLDTKIGEGGMKLSGGERQRLAIARALLRDPEILIFDEATSSLDSMTERAITETIREVDKTHETITVLVAHRLSTIVHANRIYVLEKGKIAEVGTHEELLKKKGLYYALWREQIGARE